MFPKVQHYLTETFFLQKYLKYGFLQNKFVVCFIQNNAG